MRKKIKTTEKKRGIDKNTFIRAFYDDLDS